MVTGLKRAAICVFVGLLIGSVGSSIFVRDPTGPLWPVLAGALGISIGGGLYSTDVLRDDTNDGRSTDPDV